MGNTMKELKRNISAERAKDLLIENKPLKDYYISGILDIADFENPEKRIQIKNCIVENLKSQCVQFLAKVELIDSEFKDCSFLFCYFLGGLEISNCIFNNYLDFQCGGHNKIDSNFKIFNSTFKDFVNFFDCIYNGPVEIVKNNFVKGSNLLGNIGKSYQTSFEIKPTIQGNKGSIDLDGEGGLKMNTIDLTEKSTGHNTQ